MMRHAQPRIIHKPIGTNITHVNEMNDSAITIAKNDATTSAHKAIIEANSRNGSSSNIRSSTQSINRSVLVGRLIGPHKSDFSIIPTMSCSDKSSFLGLRDDQALAHNHKYHATICLLFFVSAFHQQIHLAIRQHKK